MLTSLFLYNIENTLYTNLLHKFAKANYTHEGINGKKLRIDKPTKTGKMLQKIHNITELLNVYYNSINTIDFKKKRNKI